MINKPRFARITAAALVLTLLLPTAALADDSTSRDFDVKIVHTNDIHARVEENADSGIIGAARLAGVIQTLSLIHISTMATAEGISCSKPVKPDISISSPTIAPAMPPPNFWPTVAALNTLSLIHI